ncbi:hypothetical protein GNT15_16040 [Vibrio parahaemolyticus]|nr:hypothetical protein [Vibrio parahaemolyticus]PMT61674.1 hypothetical protein C1S87_09485 [Vibrio parahaemolyticus]PMT86460.1 hypothetical protein C1S83_14285 [Vibrio parahaemolyticus]PMT90627.1 hypothetical protein C1T03_15675 [Vibrio parahaemolyticus]
MPNWRWWCRCHTVSGNKCSQHGQGKGVEFQSTAPSFQFTMRKTNSNTHQFNERLPDGYLRIRYKLSE